MRLLVQPEKISKWCLCYLGGHSNFVFQIQSHDAFQANHFRLIKTDIRLHEITGRRMDHLKMRLDLSWLVVTSKCCIDVWRSSLFLQHDNDKWRACFHFRWVAFQMQWCFHKCSTLKENDDDAVFRVHVTSNATCFGFSFSFLPPSSQRWSSISLLFCMHLNASDLCPLVGQSAAGTFYYTADRKSRVCF